MGEVTILGAGISGLSTSFHIGHDRCQIYEAKPHYGGTFLVLSATDLPGTMGRTYYSPTVNM